MKYDAFISYRHLEKDMYVAKKVHKALETTKIPRKIQKEAGDRKTAALIALEGLPKEGNGHT